MRSTAWSAPAAVLCSRNAIFEVGSHHSRGSKSWSAFWQLTCPVRVRGGLRADLAEALVHDRAAGDRAGVAAVAAGRRVRAPPPAVGRARGRVGHRAAGAPGRADVDDLQAAAGVVGQGQAEVVAVLAGLGHAGERDRGLADGGGLAGDRAAARGRGRRRRSWTASARRRPGPWRPPPARRGRGSGRRRSRPPRARPSRSRPRPQDSVHAGHPTSSATTAPPPVPDRRRSVVTPPRMARRGRRADPERPRRRRRSDGGRLPRSGRSWQPGGGAEPRSGRRLRTATTGTGRCW